MEKELIIEELRKWEAKGFHLAERDTRVELIGKNSRLGIEFVDEPSWWITRLDGYSNSGEDITLETIKAQLELLETTMNFDHPKKIFKSYFKLFTIIVIIVIGLIIINKLLGY